MKYETTELDAHVKDLRVGKLHGWVNHGRPGLGGLFEVTLSLMPSPPLMSHGVGVTEGQAIINALNDGLKLMSEARAAILDAAMAAEAPPLEESMVGPRLTFKDPKTSWYAVDLDGTLAYWDTWTTADAIGEPIPLMVDAVKAMLANGHNVKIFTARGSDCREHADLAFPAVQAWCLKHIGRVLPITNVKDMNMRMIFDDRARQVIENRGIVVQAPPILDLAEVTPPPEAAIPTPGPETAIPPAGPDALIPAANAAT